MDLEWLFYSGDRKWTTKARCRRPDVPLDGLFFDHTRENEAKEYCNGCRARNECLEYALTVVDATQPDRLLFGVWGGMNGSERAKVRRERKLNG